MPDGVLDGAISFELLRKRRRTTRSSSVRISDILLVDAVDHDLQRIGLLVDDLVSQRHDLVERFVNRLGSMLPSKLFSSL